MKILIIDIYQNDSWRLVKDTAGGYGTGNDFGKGIVSGLLNKFVSKMIAMPPMYAMYIFSVLERKKIEVEYTRKLEQEKIQSADYIVMISSIIAHETEVEAIKMIIEKYNKKIFVTGIFANTLKENYQLNNTYVVPGEPEFFFDALEPNKETYNNFFGENKKLFHHKLSSDVGTLPYPNWEYYTKKYPLKNNFLDFNSKIAVPILATRGCPYSCFNYCTYPLQQGRKVRSRSAEDIIEEIKHWKTTLNTNKFIFRDPVFSINRKFTVELCKKIIENKLDIVFLIETHLKNLDNELLDLLYEAGLRIVYVGIESSSDVILNSIQRMTVTNDEQYEIIKNCKERNIIVKSMFMIGSPEDTEKTIKDTIEYATILPNQLVQFSVFTPYPGTPIYKDYSKKITVKKYEEFNQYNLVYKHENLDQNKLNKLKRYAYWKCYLNLSNFKVKIKSLFSIFI
mgnify:FL=1|jgi:anaerobic magnesium-protoporphyrin IX monomethyl ester cyclase